MFCTVSTLDVLLSFLMYRRYLRGSLSLSLEGFNLFLLHLLFVLSDVGGVGPSYICYLPEEEVRGGGITSQSKYR